MENNSKSTHNMAGTTEIKCSSHFVLCLAFVFRKWLASFKLVVQ